MKKDISAWDIDVKSKSKILNFNLNSQLRRNDKLINICTASSISNNSEYSTKNSEVFQYQMMKEYKTNDPKIMNLNYHKDVVSHKENKINLLIKEIKNENLLHKEYNNCLYDLRKKIKGEKDRSIVYLDKIDCIHLMKKIKTGKQINLCESYSKKEIFTNHNSNYNLKLNNFSKFEDFSKTSRLNNKNQKNEYKPIFIKKRDSVELYKKNFE